MSPYHDIPTTKLLALVQSSYDDLVRSTWRGKIGSQAIEFLVELSGLSGAVTPTKVTNPAASPKADLPQRSQVGSIQPPKISLLKLGIQTLPASPVPPLPIAAAHFPSRLQSFRKTYLAQIDQNDNATDAQDVSAEAGTSVHTVTEKLSTEARTQALLRSRLEDARQAQKVLQARVKVLRQSVARIPSPVPELKLSQPDIGGFRFDLVVSELRHILLPASLTDDQGPRAGFRVARSLSKS